MGEHTKIEWCDHTFNPWRGCVKVAAGCANCYAESQSKRNTGTLGVWGPNGTRIVAAETAWKQVEKWDREARCRCGPRFGDRKCAWCKSGCHRPSVFCGSMCDVFEDWTNIMRGSGGGYLHHANKWQRCDGRKYVEINDIAIGQSRVTMSDVRNRVFNLIDATRLTWLLLTKRPENIRPMWVEGRGYNGSGSKNTYGYRDNVWLGTSIACQEDADRTIPELLKCRDLCRGVFLSIEPLIGPVNVRQLARHESSGDYVAFDDCLTGERTHKQGTWNDPSFRVDQVIIGGESGPHARPCRPEWIRSIARQCEAAGVPCFVKQLGARPVQYVVTAVGQDEYGNVDDNGSFEVLKLRDKKGGDPSEWPEDLRKYRKLAWKGGA